ncbi:ABC transporter ATP-binding protein [Marinobacterium jannaschii]|uniref:ABC transporter ATP-binding protein n=1 Tax=Marinobacterium jannaschii TaxID=64970 RepID=UPI000485A422|nr:ATP-binding cassette domain-containing protein [Marinobacterium jannaschii]
MSKSILSAKAVAKVYREAGQEVAVLRDVSLELAVGERIAIVGSSGSGKSTLLNMLGGLDLPSSGTIRVADQDLHTQSEKARSRLRNRELGFVYQFHHLLPEFTALENVAMPLLLRGDRRNVATDAALEILAAVGLEHRTSHKPAQLSGGERQRVAIARALVGQPSCVLMDEPTGNLDRKTAEDIQALIERLNNELQTAFIIVTHDMELAHRTGRVLELVDGELLQR